MIDLLTAPDAMVFTAALVLMLAIGLVEAIGLGAAGVDLDLDIDGGPLAWLGIGQVPLLVLLVAFLATFGGLGLAGQQVATQLTGSTVSAVIAVPTVAVAALPVTALLARVLARVMPRDETTAFALDDLIGHRATIVTGRAAAGSPARARAIDPHGQPHHLLVEPSDGAASFAEGDTVLLVRRTGTAFQAILHDSPRLTNWID